MPGERKPEDEDDLIRTPYRNLESTEWWRTQQLDGLVLYSWGRPKFRKVAAAVHEAGIRLILNQDNGGLVSPLAGLRGWWRDQFNLTGGGPAFWRQLVKGFSYGLLVSDPLRAAHLRCGDVIACVSPKAEASYRKLCRIYGGADLANKVRLIPHAVEPRFHYSGGRKIRQVACVGRWQDVLQKRTWLLMEVLGKIVATDQTIAVVIAGTVTRELETWHQALPGNLRMRFSLIGHVGRDELARVLAESQVFYSPSAFESFGIAAAEALCAGCSVVAARSVSMSAFDWFVSENSGRLAGQDDAATHESVLLAELRAWENGERDPEEISRFWCVRLHADQLARRVMQILNDEL